MAVAYNPKIVTNGLKLYYDPANQKCYPGSGSAITDLSGSGAAGTLGTATTVTSEAGGIFESASSGTNFQTNSAQSISASTVSAMVWVKVTTHGNWIDLVKNNWVNSGWIIFSASDSWNVALAQSGSQYGASVVHNNSTAWTNLALTYDGTTIRLYVDGALASSSTSISNAVLDTGFPIVFAGGTRPGAYKTSLIKIYNRALTAQEINQNFNATRGRFGV
jgi:hypothetical protein